MAAKPSRLTHKTAIQLHLVVAVPFAVLAPGGQSGNFCIHPRVSHSSVRRVHEALLSYASLSLHMHTCIS